MAKKGDNKEKWTHKHKESWVNIKLLHNSVESENEMYYAQDLRTVESVSKITQESTKDNPKDFWDAEMAQFKVS